MLQSGGVSLRSVTSEPSSNTTESERTGLAATSDDTDIKTELDCTRRGVRRETADEDPTTIKGEATKTVITKKAIHVLPDGEETAPEDVHTVPFTEIEHAESGGLVRRALEVETDDATYHIRPKGRPALEDLARFLRRASWSWSRVAPRFETARDAIETLEAADVSPGEENNEREVHQAKMAISKAQSGAGRLEVAVDAIEQEIEQLRQRLNRQRVRRLVVEAEALEKSARHKRASGLLPAARSDFEAARDNYKTALSIAYDSDMDGSNKLKTRLEEIREVLYDLEVDPAIEGHEAIERALAETDPEARREEWKLAKELFEEAREQTDSQQLAEQMAFQLAWIDGVLVRACRDYAEKLITEAEEHVDNGHEQWGRQLFMAANDELQLAIEIIREREGCSMDQIKATRNRLAKELDREALRIGEVGATID